MKAKGILFRMVTAVFLISTLLFSSVSISIAADDGADGVYDQAAQYDSYKKGLSEYILTVSPGVGTVMAEQMAEKFIASGKAHGVEPKLLMAISKHESRFSSGATARDGGIGLMQVMPGTGRRFGASRESLYDPQTNIDVGASVLAANMRTFNGDWNKALAAYAYGEGRVKKGRYTLTHANRFQGTYYQIKEFLVARGYPTAA